MKNFETYSRYYDLLYKDKNYIAESECVINSIHKHNKNVSTILELGCGSGSHAVHICKKGFKVSGIELSNEMVLEAKKKNIENFEITQGNISNYDLGKKFDCAISLFHVISYLTDNKTLIDCFKTTNKHLTNGGLFLFDVWFTPAVYSQQPETRVKRLEDNDLKITRIAESDVDFKRNVVDVNFEVLISNKKDATTTVLKEKHPMRHFSIPEIEFLAELTGFEVLVVEEFLTGNTPSDQTWGVCFILKKTKNG